MADNGQQQADGAKKEGGQCFNGHSFQVGGNSAPIMEIEIIILVFHGMDVSLNLDDPWLFALQKVEKFFLFARKGDSQNAIAGLDGCVSAGDDDMIVAHDRNQDDIFGQL
jgi:hypothetical protein